jgi:hypothetical protein
MTREISGPRKPETTWGECSIDRNVKLCMAHQTLLEFSETLGFWTLFVASILKTRDHKVSENASVSVLR